MHCSRPMTLLAALALGIAPAHAPAATTPARPAVSAAIIQDVPGLLRQLDTQMVAGDIDGMRTTLRTLQSNTSLQLSPQAQVQIATSQVWVHLADEDYDAAHVLCDRILAAAPEFGWAHVLHARALQGQQQPVRAAAALADAARLLGTRASALITSWQFGELFDDLQDHPQARRDLLQSLYDVGWSIDGLAPQSLWLELAVLQAEAGNDAQVQRIAGQLTDPLELIGLEVDRRFDRWRQDRPALDVPQRMQAWLAALRGMTAGAPDNLALQGELAHALLANGDDAAVMELTGRWADATPHPTDDDANMHIGWLLHLRALAQLRLHQTTGAFATLRASTRFGAQGKPNLEQQITLAIWLIDNGEPAEGLEVLNTLEGLSDLGAGVAEAARALAYVQLGRHDALRASVQSLQARTGRERDMLLELLLAMDDLDAAAAEFTAMLQAPARRNRALQMLQDFRPQALLPGGWRREERFTQMIQREEVRSLVARYGYERAYPLTPPFGPR